MAQGRTADGRGNVVGQDFADSAGFGVLSLDGAYRISRQVNSAPVWITCSTSATPSTSTWLVTLALASPPTPVSTSRAAILVAKIDFDF